MAEKLRLGQAIEDFLVYRRSEGRALKTIKNDRDCLRALLLCSGDLFVGSIKEHHVTRLLIARGQTRSPAALGIDHSVLRSFFRWCVRNRHLGRYEDPMEGRRRPKIPKVERDRLPVGQFAPLLEAAERYHRRDRMIVALGLYLFLRGGEIATLRMRDLRLDAGEMNVVIWKTRDSDVMPISAELDSELRSWLTYYSLEQGPLDPDWLLVPACRRHMPTYDYETRMFVGTPSAERDLVPTARVTKIEQVAQRALGAVGFSLRNPDGSSRREGMHTLRRSGARARFDSLERLGYDGSIRHVQTMLHHASMSETERYIGLTLDRVKRNEIVRGKIMFEIGDNVVPLSRAAGGSQNGRGESAGV